MGKEYELKYAAAPEIQEAVYALYPGKFTEIAMETTYFDTETADFSARKWSLRRRMENGKAVYNLKKPVSPTERKEWESDKGFSHLAALCGDPEILALMEKPLIPVCGAAFTRRAALLRLPDCTVELALDFGKLTGGGKEAPICEIEVELKEGSEDAALRFAQSLAEKYGLKEEPRSKAARAMALSKGETYGL